MALYVVSDLHIRDERDPLYRSVIAILRDRVQSGDTMVLAGDVFDLFVGDKPVFVDRYQEFLSALRAAVERGATVHYIEGNHDFLLKRALGALGGVHHHGQDVSLEISGQRFFIAHGDMVDREDYGYRALRAFFRSLPLRAFVALAPGSWIDGIGRASSKRSQAATPRLPYDLPPERIARLRRMYHDFAQKKLSEGFRFVVLGHCHDLDEKVFPNGQYVNVGYPRVHDSFLVWQPGDSLIRRERLPENLAVGRPG